MASTASKKATTPRGAKTAVDRQFVTALARGMAVLVPGEVIDLQPPSAEIFKSA